jgi:hypothetical protein
MEQVTIIEDVAGVAVLQESLMQLVPQSDFTEQEWEAWVDSLPTSTRFELVASSQKTCENGP